MSVTISYIKTPKFPWFPWRSSILLLQMDWFGIDGFGWSVPEQIQEFQTHDWEVEVNELLSVIQFLFLSNIFKKQIPNPRKTDLSLCCVVKSATLPPLRQFYIKINQTNSLDVWVIDGGEIRINVLMGSQQMDVAWSALI